MLLKLDWESCSHGWWSSSKIFIYLNFPKWEKINTATSIIFISLSLLSSSSFERFRSNASGWISPNHFQWLRGVWRRRRSAETLSRIEATACIEHSHLCVFRPFSPDANISVDIHTFSVFHSNHSAWFLRISTAGRHWLLQAMPAYLQGQISRVEAEGTVFAAMHQGGCVRGCVSSLAPPNIIKR